jgi:hypothetical protein
MATFSNKNQQKISTKYFCNICDYSTSRKFNYDTHILSTKHKKSTDCNTFQQNLSKENVCINCNKNYKDRSGLWRHKKTCFSKEDLNDETKQEQLVEYLLKENAEFKQLMIEQHNQMLEQNKQMIELAKNSAGHHNTNNSNNSFNLNFFLNETCKNAMNIMDFVNQLQIGIKELEETGRLGFADGISKIFINGLKQIDVTNRPVHCSDLKREVLYIKNNGQWNKEDEDKALLTNAIKHVAHKNMKQIPEWTKENPDYKDQESKQNDQYLKIVSESMSGSSNEETNKNYTKIIKNIAKEAIIDK